MKAKEKIKRYILLIIGLFLIGFGIALTKHSELGVTTISSVPNVLSIKYDFLSIGNWLNVWNIILIIAQVAILRKDFTFTDALQIPVVLIAGLFTDIGMLIATCIPLPCYIARLAVVNLGIVVLGIGVSLTFIANVALNAAESFVRVVSRKFNKNIGNVKMAFDAFCVATAVVMSLVFFNFRIVGVREGTIIAVFFTGTIVKIFNRWIAKPLNGFLSR